MFFYTVKQGIAAGSTNTNILVFFDTGQLVCTKLYDC